MRSVIGLLVALVLAGTTLDAEAGPRGFRAPDQAGDALAGTHGDLAALSLSTRGALRSGRYSPHSLVLQLDLADSVDRAGNTTYEVDLSLPGCAGGLRAFATPGDPSAHHVSCQVQSDDLLFTLDIAPIVSGRRLTWVIAFDDFPGGAISVGQVARHIRAFTAIAGPSIGADRAPVERLHNDDLTTAAGWAIR